MTIDISKLTPDEQEALTFVRGLAVHLGGAIGLSCIAATCQSSVEDEAIAAADEAWTNLADRIVEFALED